MMVATVDVERRRADKKARPVFEVPGPGSWVLDAEHCDRPHSRWLSEDFPRIYTEGFRAGMARYGGLLETIECAMVNGFTYLAFRPVGAPPDAKGTPPRAIFWLLSRLHPALRKRIKRSAEVMEKKLWREDVDEFFERIWPRALATYERIQAIELEALDDEALIAHLEELVALMKEAFHDHFMRATASMLPVGDYAVQVMDWTSASCEEALALLRGYSPYSVEVMKELDTVAAAFADEPEARALVDGNDAAAVLQALRGRPGPVGAAVGGWLDRVGQRIVTGHDVAELRGIEMPEMMLSTLRTHLGRPPRAEEREHVEAATRAMRERVPAEHRALFDELLEEARLVFPLRDGHSVLDFWLFGLVRRSLLEAGRRLAERGKLHVAMHVVDLQQREIVALLRGQKGPSADTVAGHVARRESMDVTDAPEFLGAPPSPPPPPEWLPGVAARAARATGLYIDKMFAQPEHKAPRKAKPTKAASVIQGVGASPGVYTGTARLVLGPREFDKVRQGDVLIARITTPSYNVLLPLLGAVVTDRGGLLSHPAIVSREFGIPGVVGTREATTLIADGARVEVDGAKGTVRVL